MRNLTILVLTLVLISCSKKDKINHYLVKSITQKELENNGFYKYSYTAILDDEDQIYDTIKYVKRYTMYSHVKLEENDENLCPNQLWHYYLKNELNDRI